MKHTPVDGLIPALFEGKVTSFVSCVHVECTSSRHESFYDLQLDVKGCVNLDASFEKFVQVETLDGDNQYDAANGFGKQDAKKGLSFHSFPPILNIQLKRYIYIPFEYIYLHDRFEFPKQLNLAAYMDSTASPDSTQYHLHSILVHSGDVHGGHYYVYIRPHGQDPANTLWFKYDDDLISAVDEGDVMESSFGSPLAGVTSFSSAYMLVRTLCVNNG
ncbi:hypothetical protein DYB25_013713 [Aphanomyces astaci]|uniref:ubiquitinyl hydrolase 1 n=1 Tax=Aphanomyces astaci TaxID=112090 RepID=A0A397BXV1_APHAT|nr:hypothetical protein DYB25_013713 [Aphanomyces astaci]